MSSMLSSQGIVLATAMAVSAGTIILFDLCKERYFPSFQNPCGQDFHPNGKQVLKSCLSSSGRKRRAVKNKKRVQFADDVKDSKKNGEMYRKQQRKLTEIQKTSCANEMIGIQKIPANHVALYSGILKDRVQRLGCSY